MKFRWDKKYLYWGVTAFSVVAASILFYFGIFHMDTLKKGLGMISGIFNPLIYGAAIAYLLNPLMGLIESLIYRIFDAREWSLSKKAKKYIRFFSVGVSVIFAALIIYGLIAMLVPEIFDSITNIVDNFPRYVANVQKWITATFENNAAWDEASLDVINRYSAMLENWLTNDMMPQINNIVRNLSSGVFGFLIFIKNFLIGAIISIYILASKETFAARGKRILYAICKVEFSNKLIHNLRFVDGKFGGFIIGKVIDSMIIGILCYIFTSIFGTPYALLVSVVVGVTNIIPFFGPYLGAIPSAFLILVVSPIQCLYFVIFIIILQQIDGNFIGPRILGSSTGMSSFMVIVAILVGGGFFGIIGMFVGVPICAVIIAICQAWMDRRIAAKKLPNTLEPYIDMDSIDPETMQPIVENTSKGKYVGTLYENMKNETIRRNEKGTKREHDKKNDSED
ncbi:MAG: AI-2E family transporter [Lachnospiraceae bacterium]|nr:AI-2E family transporter [Lachnospiraceae bacterium]